MLSKGDWNLFSVNPQGGCCQPGAAVVGRGEEEGEWDAGEGGSVLSCGERMFPSVRIGPLSHSKECGEVTDHSLEEIIAQGTRERWHCCRGAQWSSSPVDEDSEAPENEPEIGR